MGISEYEYKQIIRQAKKLVPTFRYSRKMSESDKKTALGLYMPDNDLIYFLDPSKYPSKLAFARVVFHELAHWSMARGKGRVPDISTLHYSVCEPLEECIAETSSKILCQELGYRYSKSHTKYMRPYKGKIYRFSSKKQYKFYKDYINNKVDEVVRFIKDYNLPKI